jgi:hypothetical protein
MVVQGTQKQHVVMMGHINFEHQVLIKKWWVRNKMNLTSGKLKDEENGATIESCFCLLPKVMSVFEVMGFKKA